VSGSHDASDPDARNMFECLLAYVTADSEQALGRLKTRRAVASP